MFHSVRLMPMTARIGPNCHKKKPIIAGDVNTRPQKRLRFACDHLRDVCGLTGNVRCESVSLIDNSIQPPVSATSVASRQTWEKEVDPTSNRRQDQREVI